MNVVDLISELSKFPSDMPVLVNGYEEGYENIASIKIHTVAKRINPEWYYGEFDDSTDTAAGAKKAVVIGRPFRST